MGSELTRYQKGQTGNPGGRTPTKWLRSFLDAANDKSEAGATNREAIAMHLIEVATSWQVQVRGKDLEVASARDAVEAAKILFAYDMGKPSGGATVRPPTSASAGGNTLELVMDAYRDRLLSGELGESELGDLAKLLVTAEKTEAEMLAKLLGDRTGKSSILRDRVEAVLAKLEARVGAVDVKSLPSPTIPDPIEAPNDKRSESPPIDPSLVINDG